MSLKICIRIHCDWNEQRFDVRASGEGRWGLNVAQMLIKRGYNIILIPNWPIKEEWLSKNVVVVSAKEAHKYGPVDLYIDPVWGFNGHTYIQSKYILASVWLKHIIPKIPCSNMIYHYPYIWQKEYNTINEINGYKILCWPAPFGEQFIHYNDIIRTEILFSARHLQFWDWPIKNNIVIDIIKHIDNQCNLHIINTKPEKAINYIHYTVNAKFYSSVSYSFIKNVLLHSKLHIPLSHSCILDAIFQGVPPVLRESKRYGCLPFVKDYNLAVKDDNSNLLEVIDTLLNNEVVRENYLQCFRDYFHPHLEENSFYYFQKVLESLNLKDTIDESLIKSK